MKPESRWMVRVKDGVGMMYSEYVIDDTDEDGRPKFLEVSYDEVAVLVQLPKDVASKMYVTSEDGRGWVLSATGKEISGMDSVARQAFEDQTPESVEILQERKTRLKELVQNDPLPLPFAVRQLCFMPESNDPRLENQDLLTRRNAETIENAANEGRLLLIPQGNSHAVRTMDLVRYLADDAQRHNPVCDHFWRHAYRRMVEEGWMPEAAPVSGGSGLPIPDRLGESSILLSQADVARLLVQRRGLLLKTAETRVSRAVKMGRLSKTKDGIRKSDTLVWIESQPEKQVKGFDPLEV